MSVFFSQDRISRTPITIFVFKEKTVTLNQRIDKYVIKTHVTHVHTYTCACTSILWFPSEPCFWLTHQSQVWIGKDQMSSTLMEV